MYSTGHIRPLDPPPVDKRFAKELTARSRATHSSAMISVMALSASALIVGGLRPAMQPITVRALEISGDGAGLAPPGADTLADQYRNRWSGDSGDIEMRSRPRSVGDASSNAFSGGALSDVVRSGDADSAPWGDAGSVSSKAKSVGDASSNAFSGVALSDVVCIVGEDGEEVCGPGVCGRHSHPIPAPIAHALFGCAAASFDSVEGGTVCVEDDDGRVVCADADVKQ